MSTNKTPNYGLHTWEPTDHFLRSEVNENFAALDAALKTEAQQADQALKAETSARSTALTALETALRSELQRANSRARVVVGSYTGTGEAMRVELGVRPLAVLIENPQGVRYTSSNNIYGGMLCSGLSGLGGYAAIDGTGFTLAGRSSSNMINTVNGIMVYLAVLPGA